MSGMEREIYRSKDLGVTSCKQDVNNADSGNLYVRAATPGDTAVYNFAARGTRLRYVGRASSSPVEIGFHWMNTSNPSWREKNWEILRYDKQGNIILR